MEVSEGSDVEADNERRHRRKIKRLASEYLELDESDRKRFLKEQLDKSEREDVVKAAKRLEKEADKKKKKAKKPASDSEEDDDSTYAASESDSSSEEEGDDDGDKKKKKKDKAEKKKKKKKAKKPASDDDDEETPKKKLKRKHASDDDDDEPKAKRPKTAKPPVKVEVPVKEPEVEPEAEPEAEPEPEQEFFHEESKKDVAKKPRSRKAEEIPDDIAGSSVKINGVWLNRKCSNGKAGINGTVPTVYCVAELVDDWKPLDDWFDSKLGTRDQYELAIVNTTQLPSALSELVDMARESKLLPKGGGGKIRCHLLKDTTGQGFALPVFPKAPGERLQEALFVPITFKVAELDMWVQYRRPPCTDLNHVDPSNLSYALPATKSMPVWSLSSLVRKQRLDDPEGSAEGYAVHLVLADAAKRTPPPGFARKVPRGFKGILLQFVNSRSKSKKPAKSEKAKPKDEKKKKDKTEKPPKKKKKEQQPKKKKKADSDSDSDDTQDYTEAEKKAMSDAFGDPDEGSRDESFADEPLLNGDLLPVEDTFLDVAAPMDTDAVTDSLPPVVLPVVPEPEPPASVATTAAVVEFDDPVVAADDEVKSQAQDMHAHCIALLDGLPNRQKGVNEWCRNNNTTAPWNAMSITVKPGRPRAEGITKVGQILTTLGLQDESKRHVRWEGSFSRFALVPKAPVLFYVSLDLDLAEVFLTHAEKQPFKQHFPKSLRQNLDGQMISVVLLAGREQEKTIVNKVTADLQTCTDTLQLDKPEGPEVPSS